MPMLVKSAIAGAVLVIVLWLAGLLGCAGPTRTVRAFNSLETAMAAAEELNRAAVACGKSGRRFHAVMEPGALSWYCE